jgi:hypothetical protein
MPLSPSVDSVNHLDETDKPLVHWPRFRIMQLRV